MDNNIERGEVSRHEVMVYLALCQRSKEWLTNKEISKVAGVAERTTRMHTLRLVKLGIIDQAEVFPAHRYKWSSKASKRNAAYVQRLEQASEVFGLKTA